MQIALLILLIAAAMLLLPAMPLLLARLGGGSNALEASFAQQQVPHAGGSILATQLQVLHRSPGMTEYGDAGDLMLVDASWLCRAPDGSYLLALGQGMRSWRDMATTSTWNRKPLDIHWTWRTLTEAQARQFASHDAGALRESGRSEASNPERDNPS